MQVLFIRHATAHPASAAGDAQRKLTKQGTCEARMLGSAVKAMEITVDKILTSPLVRAVQTAAIVAEELGADVDEAEFLAPGGGQQNMRRRLAELSAQGVKCVALVGHCPSLEQMIGELIAGDPKVGISLAKAGAAMVETADGAGNAELCWLLRRRQIELMQKYPS